MIPSLTELSLNTVADNISRFEKDPNLSRLPQELGDQLMAKLLSKPDFKPEEGTLSISARCVDLTYTKELRDDKMWWIFNRCKAGLEELILPASFHSSFTLSLIEKVFQTEWVFRWDFVALARSIAEQVKLTFQGQPLFTHSGIDRSTSQLTKTAFTELKVLRLKNEDDSKSLYDTTQFPCTAPLTALAANCPKLEELYMDSYRGIIPEDFFRHFPLLRVLEIRNSGIGEEGLLTIEKHCPKLEKLSLLGLVCPTFPPQLVKFTLQNLKYFDCGETTFALQALAKTDCKIEVLSAYRLSDIEIARETDIPVNALLDRFSDLRCLAISAPPGIGLREFDFDKLLKNHPKLISLIIVDPSFPLYIHILGKKNNSEHMGTPL